MFPALPIPAVEVEIFDFPCISMEGAVKLTSPPFPSPSAVLSIEELPTRTILSTAVIVIVPALPAPLLFAVILAWLLSWTD